MRDDVTVVSGLPRSGTSLLMQMLAAGGLPTLSDGVRIADEDNPKGYWEYEPVKQPDKSWLNHARGKAVKMVHLLLKDLPPDRNYSVLLIRRNIKEVLASQRVMLDRHGRKGAAIPEETLGKIFLSQLDMVETWMAAQACFRILSINYNELVSDIQQSASKINSFLGETLDESAMSAALDQQLYRQRAD